MLIFKNRHLLAATLLLAFVISYGCSASREITNYSELKDAYYKNEPVRVLTGDYNYYTFDSFNFTDSTISGTGTRNSEGSEENFEGSLAFSEIVFMERLTKSVGKGLWMVPVVAGLFGGTYALTQPAQFEIWRTASSCPFIYSFDGFNFHLEAEAFSTAVSKALETKSFHVLRLLANNNGEVKVRISNERPETHLFNSVKLYAVDVPNSSNVILDNEDNVWAYSDNKPPEKAQGPLGYEIQNLLEKKDSQYWKSDMNSVTSESDFRDRLLLQFEQPGDRSEALLIVNAINSELITEIYRTAGALIGDERLGFYHALEQDSALQNYFREWIDRSSLLVEIKGDKGWLEAGRLLPEANEVSFSRAIRLRNLDQVSGPLTLRISSMIDVWHLDAISVAYTSEGPLPMEAMELSSLYTTGPGDDREIESAISDSDSSYTMILPPDYMELTFDVGPADNMLNPAYLISAEGYLYEWFPEATGATAPSIIPNWFKNIDRDEMLGFFTGREDLFLHAIYAGWEQERNRKKENIGTLKQK